MQLLLECWKLRTAKPHFSLSKKYLQTKKWPPPFVGCLKQEFESRENFLTSLKITCPSLKRNESGKFDPFFGVLKLHFHRGQKYRKLLLLHVKHNDLFVRPFCRETQSSFHQDFFSTYEGSWKPSCYIVVVHWRHWKKVFSLFNSSLDHHRFLIFLLLFFEVSYGD